MTQQLILEFGKFKGMNFESTPDWYQKWLLKQDFFLKQAQEKFSSLDIFNMPKWYYSWLISQEWYRTQMEEKAKLKREAEKEQFQNIVLDAESLISKAIYAEGWHYDMSGFVNGVITAIKPISNTLEIEVIVEPKKDSGSMNSFTFGFKNIERLINDGEIPEASRLLNTGTNAKLL